MHQDIGFLKAWAWNSPTIFEYMGSRADLTLN
jgi:hypothetical protein